MGAEPTGGTTASTSASRSAPNSGQVYSTGSTPPLDRPCPVRRSGSTGARARPGANRTGRHSPGCRPLSPSRAPKPPASRSRWSCRRAAHPHIRVLVPVSCGAAYVLRIRIRSGDLVECSPVSTQRQGRAARFHDRRRRHRTLPPPSISPCTRSVGPGDQRYRRRRRRPLSLPHGQRRAAPAPAHEKPVSPTRFAPRSNTLAPPHVKLGQLIASSPGVFTEELSAEFESLLDRVPPADRTRSPPCSSRNSVPARRGVRHLRPRAHRLGVDRPGAHRNAARRPKRSSSKSSARGSLTDLPPTSPSSSARPASSRSAEYGRMLSARHVVEDFANGLDEELDFRNEAAAMREWYECLQPSKFGDQVPCTPGVRRVHHRSRPHHGTHLRDAHR